MVAGADQAGGPGPPMPLFVGGVDRLGRQRASRYRESYWSSPQCAGCATSEFSPGVPRGEVGAVRAPHARPLMVLCAAAGLRDRVQWW